MRLTISVKMGLLTAAMTLLLVAVLLFTAIHYMSIPLQTQTSTTLEQAHTLVTVIDENVQERYRNLAELEAVSPMLGFSATSGDTAAASKNALELMQRNNADMAIITDMDGKVIGRGHAPEENGDNLKEQALINAALKGKTVTGFFSDKNVPLAQGAAVPLIYSNSQRGVLVLGVSLTSEAYVDTLKQRTGMEITFFRGDTRVQTTLLNSKGARMVGTRLSDTDISQKVLTQGQTVHAENVIGGNPFISLYWPLPDADGKTLGMGFAGIPAAKGKAQYYNGIRTTLLVCLGLYIPLQVLFLLFVMRLMRPIRQTAVFAERVANDEPAELDVHSKDDLGQLADALRRMVDKLREQKIWYQGILDCLPFAVSVTDSRMRWVYANPLFISNMGKTSLDEILGHPCHEKGSPNCKTPKCGVACLRRGTTASSFVDAQGRSINLHMSYLKNSAGENIGHVEISIDTTEQERLKKQAEAAAHEARQSMAAQLDEVVSSLASASEQLSHSLHNMDKRSGQVAQRVTETATAMQEMNATVSEVAGNAEETAQVSGSMLSRAQEGATLVNNTIANMQEVRQRSMGLKNDMAQLDEQARSIGTVLTLIRDIADQTNLLALNAAIEAARAGEAGRGFAVVADEVRKLAEKSMDATRDVEKAVQTIQQGTARSTAAVESTVDDINAAATEAEHSGAALSAIADLAHDSSNRVQTIATAATQQSATSEEINRNLNEVNDLADVMVQAVQQATTAVESLENQAHVLSDVLNRMRAE